MDRLYRLDRRTEIRRGSFGTLGSGGVGGGGDFASRSPLRGSDSLGTVRPAVQGSLPYISFNLQKLRSKRYIGHKFLIGRYLTVPNLFFSGRPVPFCFRSMRGAMAMGTIDELRRRSESTRTAGTADDDSGRRSLAARNLPPDEPRPWYVPTAAVLAASSAGRLPPAAPCGSCQCPLFWLDSYGKVHCAECRQPASQSMQRGDLHVVLVDGEPAWLHDHAELTASATPSDTGKGRGERSATADELAWSELRPTLEQIESGECVDDSEPCPKCGRKFLEENFLAGKFCRICKPRSEGRAIRESSAEHLRFLSRRAWHRGELHPETARRREERLRRLASPPDAVG